MRKIALVAGILAAAAAMVASLTLPTSDQLLLCRTCGAERILTRRWITGSTLQDTVKESTVSIFARSRFDLDHAHRWNSKEEFEALVSGARTRVIRPIDEQARASVQSITERLERYHKDLGRVFLRTWIDPPEDEPAFKTTYLSLLVLNERKILPTPADEQLTFEVYLPLLTRPMDPAAERKIVVWVALKMEEK